MTITELKEKLISLANWGGEKFEEYSNSHKGYPFNEYELLISKLLVEGKLSWKQYLAIRKEYLTSEKNKNLNLYEYSNPKFGKWAEKYIKERCDNFKKSGSKHFDCFIDDFIKVEVKSSRAAESKKSGTLAERALYIDSNKKYWMNFQQVKPRFCDVIVLIGVFLNEIIIWVMTSDEMKNHEDYIPTQHEGNIGEGQFHVRAKDKIAKLEGFKVNEEYLEQAIRDAYERGTQ